MEVQTCSTTQREELAKELKTLRPDVTPNDRKEALKHLGLKDRTTISPYLNGRVKSIDTAAALILFFKGQIHRRNLVLIDTKAHKTASAN